MQGMQIVPYYHLYLYFKPYLTCIPSQYYGMQLYRYATKISHILTVLVSYSAILYNKIIIKVYRIY